MFSGHFYNATLRKLVAVFGTMFNNISVVRRNSAGDVTNITRVPLAYGPKQKFLARIDEQQDANKEQVAIKLPRMAFEIVSLTYDTAVKLGKFNTQLALDPDDDNGRKVLRSPVPYRIGIQLNIMAKNQDDALQILEQILPYFQPEYTVTVKDLSGITNINTDVPITLTSVTMSDDYEGDFLTRRSIIYALDFELRARFYGPVSRKQVIKTTLIDIAVDAVDNKVERLKSTVDPLTANEGDTYNIVDSIDFFTDTDAFEITVESGSGSYTAGETITGSVSGTTATVRSFANNVVTVVSADGRFRTDENITGGSSSTTRAVSSITAIFP